MRYLTWGLEGFLYRVIITSISIFSAFGSCCSSRLLVPAKYNLHVYRPSFKEISHLKLPEVIAPRHRQRKHKHGRSRFQLGPTSLLSPTTYDRGRLSWVSSTYSITWRIVHTHTHTHTHTLSLSLRLKGQRWAPTCLRACPNRRGASCGCDVMLLGVAGAVPGETHVRFVILGVGVGVGGRRRVRVRVR